MKLSNLDQLTPDVYLPILFFYRGDESNALLTTPNHVPISQQLKQSLSDTLTSFYPLAGSIQDNFVVNCDDNGVVFVDSLVEARHMVVLKEHDNIKEKYLKQYVPSSLVDNDDRNSSTISNQRPLLLIQVTCFDCGGISVGVSFLHKMVDFASIVVFVDAWARACRGECGDEVSRVRFDLANFFPARVFRVTMNRYFPCLTRISLRKCLCSIRKSWNFLKKMLYYPHPHQLSRTLLESSSSQLSYGNIS